MITIGGMPYRLLANLVLIVHVAFIGFVIAGLLLTVIGAVLRWEWVRNFWFRIGHFAAIGIVVVQSYLGIECPLTTLENVLRTRARQDPYAPSGFIDHWLHSLIFFDAEGWVFTLGYSLFGLAVLATLMFAPPRWPWRGEPVVLRTTAK